MTKISYFNIEDLSPLYEDVQSTDIFPDSKFFVDCIPKFSTAQILDDYNRAKQDPGFDLASFVATHFAFPVTPDTRYQSANKPISQHLQELWSILKREPSSDNGTLLPLPYPYIVPGGRFREVYYWDTYFTMLGLEVSQQFELVQNMVDNFAYLVREFGFIPNGNRSYYLGRSQPPFFALMIDLLAAEKGEEVLLKYRTELEQEYAFWMEGEGLLKKPGDTHRRLVMLPDGLIANRYWDDRNTPRPEAWLEDIHMAQQSSNPPEVTYRHIRAAAESGWDFSSRWFADGINMKTIQTTDIIPIDLNCLLLHLEKTLFSIYSKTADTSRASAFQSKIANRKKIIDEFCWNEEAGFYFDYHHVNREKTGAYTLAAAYPLFFQIADSRQAGKTADLIHEKFLYPGGLVTTIHSSGQQWDAPNGWAPLQWIAYKGMRQYGFVDYAKQIRENWTRNIAQVYSATGKMMEKYNVVDNNTNAGGGEYPNQDGFGWTNGVYLKMMQESGS